MLDCMAVPTCSPDLIDCGIRIEKRNMMGMFGGAVHCCHECLAAEPGSVLDS